MKVYVVKDGNEIVGIAANAVDADVMASHQKDGYFESSNMDLHIYAVMDTGGSIVGTFTDPGTAKWALMRLDGHGRIERLYVNQLNEHYEEKHIYFQVRMQFDGGNPSVRDHPRGVGEEGEEGHDGEFLFAVWAADENAAIRRAEEIRIDILTEWIGS